MHICRQITITEKEAIILNESKEENREGFEGRKQKGEMLSLNYNLKTKAKSKRMSKEVTSMHCFEGPTRR